MLRQSFSPQRASPDIPARDCRSPAVRRISSRRSPSSGAPSRCLEQPIGGWKCSLPPAPDRINAAPILAPTIFRTSPCAIAATGAIARIEPEVAFVLGRDLPSRATPYSEAEVRAAIGETRLVLELLGTRYADPAAADWLEMMADCVQNQGLYVGPMVAHGPDAPLAAFPVTISGANGRPVDARRTAWRRTPAAPTGLAREFPRGARRGLARGAGRHHRLVRRRDRGADERDADGHVRRPRRDHDQARPKIMSTAS